MSYEYNINLLDSIEPRGLPSFCIPYLTRYRSFTAPDRESSRSTARCFDDRRPNTTPIRVSQGNLHNWGTDIARTQSHSRARYRWRVGITDGNSASPSSSCLSNPATPAAIWGYNLNRHEAKARGVWGGCRCSCPIDRCLVCSPARRWDKVLKNDCRAVVPVHRRNARFCQEQPHDALKRCGIEGRLTLGQSYTACSIVGRHILIHIRKLRLVSH